MNYSWVLQSIPNNKYIQENYNLFEDNSQKEDEVKLM